MNLARLLTWALALSWTPLALVVVAACVLRQPVIGFGVALTMILWIMKLCEMFGVLTQERKRP